MFGQAAQPAMGVFGAPAAGATPGFGMAAPAFGAAANPATAFGGQPASSFASAGGAFGAPAFGQPAAPAFGAAPGFGAPATGSFGAAPGAAGFGAAPGAAGFGSPAGAGVAGAFGGMGGFGGQASTGTASHPYRSTVIVGDNNERSTIHSISAMDEYKTKSLEVRMCSGKGDAVDVFCHHATVTAHVFAGAPLRRLQCWTQGGTSPCCLIWSNPLSVLLFK
jgi:hypothetical protein